MALIFEPHISSHIEMPDKDKIKEDLELFNRKAQDVLSSVMLVELYKSGTGIRFDDNGQIESTHGPTANQIKAFALDIRFFMQKKERCSFQALARLYQDAPVEEWIKKHFESAYNYLQTYLSAPSLDQEYEGKRISNHELFDIFMYGALAHADRDKEALFNKWMGDPVFATYLQQEFVWMLRGLCFVISYIRDLNVKALSQLE